MLKPKKPEYWKESAFCDGCGNVSKLKMFILPNGDHFNRGKEKYDKKLLAKYKEYWLCADCVAKMKRNSFSL